MAIVYGLYKEEPGWRRLDGADDRIVWGIKNVPSARPTDYRNQYCYGGSFRTTFSGHNVGGYANFNFRGSKLRLIIYAYPGNFYSPSITIDGQKYYYNPKTSSVIYRYVAFEKIDLPYGEHYVYIDQETSALSGYPLNIDAIDIDDTGDLLGPSPMPIITNFRVSPTSLWSSEQLTKTINVAANIFMSGMQVGGLYQIYINSVAYGNPTNFLGSTAVNMNIPASLLHSGSNIIFLRAESASNSAKRAENSATVIINPSIDIPMPAVLLGGVM